VRLWSARTAASFFISRFFIFVKSCFSSETGLLCVLCPDGTRQQQASHLAASSKSLGSIRQVTWQHQASHLAAVNKSFGSSKQVTWQQYTSHLGAISASLGFGIEAAKTV